MREIKFRAWNTKKDGWVVFKGALLFLSNEPFNIMDLTPLDAEIIIEQYTGLRDAKGKEIYEGDVVKDSTGLCLVTWNPIFACFCLRRDGWMFDHFFGEAVDPFDCEVIGNIHESPELLDVK